MLDDEQIEAVAQTAASAYMQCTNFEDFVEIMDEFHYNTPHYAYKVMYRAIQAFDKE